MVDQSMFARFRVDLAAGLNLQLNGDNHLTCLPYLSELPMGEESCGSGKPLGDRNGR